MWSYPYLLIKSNDAKVIREPIRSNERIRTNYQQSVWRQNSNGNRVTAEISIKIKKSCSMMNSSLLLESHCYPILYKLFLPAIFGLILQRRSLSFSFRNDRTGWIMWNTQLMATLSFPMTMEDWDCVWTWNRSMRHAFFTLSRQKQPDWSRRNSHFAWSF